MNTMISETKAAAAAAAAATSSSTPAASLLVASLAAEKIKRQHCQPTWSLAQGGPARAPYLSELSAQNEPKNGPKIRWHSWNLWDTHQLWNCGVYADHTSNLHLVQALDLFPARGKWPWEHPSLAKSMAGNSCGDVNMLLEPKTWIIYVNLWYLIMYFMGLAIASLGPTCGRATRESVLAHCPEFETSL